MKLHARVLWKALALISLAAVAFVTANVPLVEWSVRKRYDIELPPVVVASDPSTMARGKHLAESLGKCKQCHGEDLGGGAPVEHGPFGVSQGPNLTAGKYGVRYTDAELARL